MRSTGAGTRLRRTNQYNESVFDECVRPAVAAGQARIITPPFVVSDSLTVETAPGHTAGHALLRLESRDERAYFTEDAFHHPVQVERPELCLPGCDDPAEAVATRRALVSRLERERVAFSPLISPRRTTGGSSGRRPASASCPRLPGHWRSQRVTRADPPPARRDQARHRRR